MDLCRDCLEFAMVISKRSETWRPPHGFWNTARQRSGFCNLCKMVSDYKRDNADTNRPTLGEHVKLFYSSFEAIDGHRPLSSLTLRAESGWQIRMDVWSDLGKYTFSFVLGNMSNDLSSRFSCPSLRGSL
jgi:hypothetical protein